MPTSHSSLLALRTHHNAGMYRVASWVLFSSLITLSIFREISSPSLPYVDDSKIQMCMAFSVILRLTYPMVFSSSPPGYFIGISDLNHPRRKLLVSSFHFSFPRLGTWHHRASSCLSQAEAQSSAPLFPGWLSLTNATDFVYNRILHPSELLSLSGTGHSLSDGGSATACF